MCTYIILSISLFLVLQMYRHHAEALFLSLAILHITQDGWAIILLPYIAFLPWGTAASLSW